MLLDDFDKENGLLGIDRDLYLSIVQFLNCKTLRRYIGFSEETFDRTKHSYYNVYRIKFDKTPLRNLIRDPDIAWVLYFGRTLICNSGHEQFILKETIFESIFEIKLSYDTNFLSIKQISANSPPYRTRGSGMMCYGIYPRTEHVQYMFEEHVKSTVYLESHLYNETGANYLTVVLDMRKGQNKLYFKINGVALPLVISKIPHSKRQIEFDFVGGAQINIISAMQLTNLPINLSQKKVYLFQFS